MPLTVPPGPEPANPTPRPRSDLSGGYLEMAVTRGVEQHRMRFHLRHFRYDEELNTSITTVGGDTVTITSDYSYVNPPASIGGGNEQSVGATISNLRDVISWFYNNDWNIAPARLLARIADPDYDPLNPTRDHPYDSTLLEVQMPMLSVRDVLGVCATASPNGASMIELQFVTRRGTTPDGFTNVGKGRARVTFLDSGVFDGTQIPKKVEGVAADANADHPVVGAIAYLGAAAGETFNSPGVVAHNGMELPPHAKVIHRMYQRWMRRMNRNAVWGTP